MLPNSQFRVVFYPSDYAASVRFYQQGLGLAVDHDWDYGAGDKGVLFIAGLGMVELLGQAEGQPKAPPSGVSLVIQVASADEWYQLAQDRGLMILEPPTTYPWGHRYVRLVDPDGVIVSLFEVVP